jgi:hypothetical protein
MFKKKKDGEIDVETVGLRICHRSTMGRKDQEIISRHKNFS